MKNIANYIIILKIILEFIIVFSSFFISKIIRENIDFWSLPIQTLHNINLFNYSLIWATFLVFVFAIHWLYKFDFNNKISNYSRIILYWFYSFLFFSVFVYLSQWFLIDTQIPRLIIGFSFSISIILIIIERILLNIIQYKFSKKSKIIIFTNNIWNDIYKIINKFKRSKKYKLLALANNYKIWAIWIKEIGFEKVLTKIQNRKVDEILYINSDLSTQDKIKLKEISSIFWVKYKFIPNPNNLKWVKTLMVLMDKLPVLELKYSKLDWWNSIVKRTFDIILWLLWIIIFFPILIIVAILIKIEDPAGPVIFKNRRVWKDWKEFDLYKFKYMKWEFCTKESYKVSEKEKKEALEYEKKLIKEKSIRSWPLYKIKNDPRKTKIWVFIEKYSIDELPQLFNVILWNMSIVWPRPHQLREVEKYEIEHKRLLTIKPWITGMAQVNWRENNTFDDEANLDLYYIDNWSILLEIKILFKTIYIVLTRK